MEISEMLQNYEGKEIDLSSLPPYARCAIPYFATADNIINPHVQITIQLEITQALNQYRQHFKSTPGASFTAYLIWNLVQSMNKLKEFNYRLIGNKWYHFEHPPVFIPVAANGPDRFREVILEKVGKKTWKEFTVDYRNNINEALAGRAMASGNLSENVFFVSTIISNLPNIQFTSYQSMISKIRTGRSAVIFGKRYQLEGKDYIPLSITLHHSVVDPEMFNQLLKDFNERLISTSTSQSA